MNNASPPEPQRIAEITLDERTVIRRSRAIEDERTAAIADLLKDNQFTPLSGRDGPFHLHLAIEENRLVMDIRAAADGSSESVVLPLAPFRRASPRSRPPKLFPKKKKCCTRSRLRRRSIRLNDPLRF